MATPFRIKRSAVPNKRPQLNDLQLGELAFNFYDGRLFAKKDTAGVGVGTTVTLLNPWTENIGGGIYYTDGNVGIGSTIPTSKLWVQGDARFTGITTFNNIVVDGTVGAGLTTGVVGQYLRATGTGVTWASFPTLRTTGIVTATEGQTSFTFAYNTNFLDVFVNGVRLTPSEYVANNGASITLNNAAFQNDIVEFVSYQTTSNTASGTGGAIILDDLTDVNLSGIPSTGQLLRYSGDFWVNDAEMWNRTSAGIHTLSNVGIGTTNPSGAGAGTKLYVTGSEKLTGSLFLNSTSQVQVEGSGGTYGDCAIEFDGGYPNSGIRLYHRNSGNYESIVFDSGSLYPQSGYPSVDLGTSSEPWNIAYLNSVGINTSNPTSLLRVEGNSLFTGITTVGLGTNLTTISPIGRGRIGIGTTNPLTNLHIVGFATTASSSTSTYPTIRLEVKDTALNDRQKYGSIEFFGNDSSTNASGLRASIDATSTSTTGGTTISIKCAGDSSSTLGAGTTFASNQVDFNQAFINYNNAAQIVYLRGGNDVDNEIYSLGNTTYRKVNVIGNRALSGGGATERTVDLRDYIARGDITGDTPWTRVVNILVSGSFTPGVGGVGTARFMKEWKQLILWNNVTQTYSIEAASITTSFSSAPGNWPATVNAGVNTTGAFIRVGVNTCDLVLQPRAGVGIDSTSYWAYEINTLMA